MSKKMQQEFRTAETRGKHARHYRHRELGQMEAEAFSGESERMVRDARNYLIDKGVDFQKADRIAEQARAAWSRMTPQSPGSKFSKQDRGRFLQEVIRIEREQKQRDREILDQLLKALGPRF